MIKNVLRLLLLCFFIFQLRESIQKLSDGVPGTSLSYEEDTITSMPSFTMCVVPWIAAEGNVDNPSLVDEYKRLEKESFVSQVYFTNSMVKDVNFTKKNLRSDDVLKSMGLNWTDVWNVYYGRGVTNQIHRCETFTAPNVINPSPRVLLQLILAVPAGNQLIVKLHEHGQITSVYDRHLGGAFVLLSPLGPGHIYVLEISRSRVVNLDGSEGYRCNDDDDDGTTSNFAECLASYIDEHMECSLPWRNNTPDRPCSLPSDTLAYLNLSETFSTLTLEAIKATTGCRNRCKYTRYQTSQVSDFPDENLMNANLTSVIFMMSDPYVKVEKEVRTYDTNSFFGDAGGYLGLLLGLSFLDLYDLALVAVGVVAKWCGHKKSYSK